MQINNVNNRTFMLKQQNFERNAAIEHPFSRFNSYKSLPLHTSKAYVTPQISQVYKEIETFEVPYVSEGKLYELANGHKLIVIPKKGSFIINTFVKAGQKHEPITGHFLEHLITNNKNEIDGESVSNMLDNIGASYQATTHLNYTDYFLKTHVDNSENIEKLIKIQSELLQKPKFSLPDIEKERNILISEYVTRDKKNNFENMEIDYLILNELLSLNEKPDESYRFDPIKLVKSMNFKKLTDFYNKYYNNNNMITVMIGGSNPDEIVKIFNRYFNKPNLTKTTKKEPKRDLSIPIQKTKRIDIQTKSYIENNIRVNFVGPKSNDEKANFIILLLNLYIKDKNSGFDIRHISTDEYPTNDSLLSFIAESSSGKEEEVLKDLYDKIFDLVKSPISDEDFDALKLKLKDLYSMNNEYSSVLVNSLGKDLIENNRSDYFNNFKYLETLKKEDIQNFIDRYIDFNKTLVVVAHNELKSVSNIQPAFTGTIKEIDTKNITEYKYPNNLQLLVDTSEGVTRTKYGIMLRSDKIPDIKPGVYELLQLILGDIFDDDKIFKTLCLKSEYEIEPDRINLSISTLPEQTNEAIQFVNSKLQSPNFTQELFDKNKDLLKIFNKDIIDEKISASYRIKYENHPYKYSISKIATAEERLKKIDEIQLSNVIDLYNQIVNNAQGKAVLVIPKNEFEKQKQNILEKIVVGFPQFKPLKKLCIADKINIKSIDKTKIFIHEGQTDSGSISLEFQMINNEDFKESLIIDLLTKILGSGESGRLFSDIRTNQGLAYVAGSTYESDPITGYFRLGAELLLNKETSNNLRTTLDLLNDNVSKLINYKIDDKELQRAKNQLIAKLSGLMETSLGRYAWLNMDEFNNVKNLFRDIDAITSQDIQNFAEKYFTQPPIITIYANKDVIVANKDYIEKLGEVINLS